MGGWVSASSRIEEAHGPSTRNLMDKRLMEEAPLGAVWPQVNDFPPSGLSPAFDEAIRWDGGRGDVAGPI